MNANLVTIEIDGKLTNIDEKDLRISDLVIIQTGDIVPADLRLIEFRGLEIDEFEITGELLPVEKKISKDDVIAYHGSRVIRGYGKGVVLSTGEQTEYGKVLSQEGQQNQPYTFRIIDKENLWTIILFLPVFVLLFVQSYDLTLLIIFLFFSFVLNLLQNDNLCRYLIISNESKRLKRAHVQIRDIRALEHMGDINLVCFDKTGVLTTRQMDIKKVYFPDLIIETENGTKNIEESVAQLVYKACALCNDVLFFQKTILANPIDLALIRFAQKNRIDLNELLLQYKRIYDKPFDSEHRYMACGFETSTAGSFYFAKGDPEVIYKLCNRHFTSSGSLENNDFGFWLTCKSQIEAIAQNGDTAIALAYASGNFDDSPKEYSFLCLLQLENSLQPGTQEIIRQFAQKGIRSLLLTGDKAETAVRIGAESGITAGQKAALTGRIIDRMEWAEVIRQASYCSVFARLTPSQKGILVRQLQKAGNTVAMVGDGPNDGIALKVADVGISLVNNSSSIARKLSQILINDLTDLITILDGAFRIKNRVRQCKLGRILIIVFSFIYLYFWVGSKFL